MKLFVDWHFMCKNVCTRVIQLKVFEIFVYVIN